MDGLPVGGAQATTFGTRCRLGGAVHTIIARSEATPRSREHGRPAFPGLLRSARNDDRGTTKIPRAPPPRPERLSWLSSWEAPRFSISQDCVEDDEELADAGGERLFGWFSGGSELLIMRGDEGVRAACDQ